jgi:RNA polymerase sigma-70 factor, ECF subfamily
MPEGHAEVPRLHAADFPALVVAHSGALHRMASSLARERTAAEDLVQDTFVRALERRAQYRGGDVRAWLRRILHNLAIDRARRSSHELLVDDVEGKWADDEYTVDAAVVVERAELRRELEDALARLPFIYRTAVLLHDAEGWTVREIADAVGVGLPAAKQRLRRGRMMLVTALAGSAERRTALEGVPMRCWDARRKVSDYVDGGLATAERRALEAHLERCPTCPPLYASLVGVRAGLTALRDPDAVIGPELAARLHRIASAS